MNAEKVDIAENIFVMKSWIVLTASHNSLYKETKVQIDLQKRKSSLYIQNSL